MKWYSRMNIVWNLYSYFSLNLVYKGPVNNTLAFGPASQIEDVECLSIGNTSMNCFVMCMLGTPLNYTHEKSEELHHWAIQSNHKWQLQVQKWQNNLNHKTEFSLVNYLVSENACTLQKIDIMISLPWLLPFPHLSFLTHQRTVLCYSLC